MKKWSPPETLIEQVGTDFQRKELNEFQRDYYCWFATDDVKIQFPITVKSRRFYSSVEWQGDMFEWESLSRGLGGTIKHLLIVGQDAIAKDPKKSWRHV